jgi:hypothetical protein
MSGSSQRSSSSSYTKPWKEQAPYLVDIYERAAGQSYQPRSFYDDPTYVPHSSQTQMGLAGMQSRALGGSPNVQAAQGYNIDALQGQYLHPESNPYLQATYDAAARPVMRGLQTAAIPGASMSGYGRAGSGAEANRYDRATDAGGRALTDLSAQIFGGNYARERGAQMQAATQAAQLGDYDYRDLGALLDVGGRQEELSGRVLNDLMERFYFQQEEPRDRLREYAGLIGGPVTTSKSSSSSLGASGGLT